MFAISVMKGTRYACHIYNKGDQTCLPYKCCSGQNILAIVSEGYQICLKILKSVSFKERLVSVESDWTIRFVFSLRIISASQIRPEVNVNCQKLIFEFSNMVSIYSPLKKRWHAYLVPNITDMAGINCPLCNQHGERTFFPSCVMTDIAGISSPHLNWYGRQVQPLCYKY